MYQSDEVRAVDHVPHDADDAQEPFAQRNVPDWVKLALHVTPHVAPFATGTVHDTMPFSTVG